MAHTIILKRHANHVVYMCEHNYPHMDLLNYSFAWLDMDAHLHAYLYVKLMLDTSRD
jgi:hypothetical protein